MPYTSPFSVLKVEATGNDFLLIDLTDTPALVTWNKEFGQRARADLAREWCDRHFGLGADGLVILEQDPHLDFRWDFYNSDGSEAEMCGNATRAVSLFFSQKISKQQIEFNTRTGPVSAEVNSPNDIQVQLAAIAGFEWGLKTAQGQAYDFVSTGNPHAVVNVTNLQNKDVLKALALAVKAEPRFQQAGTNVTFVRQFNDSVIESQTFERGVEDFTLSCGTGAVAAAFSILRGTEDQRMEVRVPGGTLFVIWKKGRPTLIGPAVLIAEMRLIR